MILRVMVILVILSLLSLFIRHTKLMDGLAPRRLPGRDCSVLGAPQLLPDESNRNVGGHVILHAILPDGDSFGGDMDRYKALSDDTVLAIGTV